MSVFVDVHVCEYECAFMCMCVHAWKYLLDAMHESGSQQFASRQNEDSEELQASRKKVSCAPVCECPECPCLGGRAGHSRP